MGPGARRTIGDRLKGSQGRGSTPRARPFLVRAKPEDAETIATLRCEVAQDMTRRFGKGPWSGSGTVRGVRWDMRRGRLFVARRGRRIIACLTLDTRRPWAIDATCFGPCRRPHYLTAMAVAPEFQRRGVGRRCLADLSRKAIHEDADAIRLCAFDADAGAGGFYASCGFREVARVRYRNTPLIYFEWLVGGAERRSM